MKQRIFGKSAVALAAGLCAAFAANAFVVGPAAAPVVTAGVNAATDLAINAGGTGHILFVPYYSAQNGNRTYLTLTNTDTRNGKIAKVRFRGASNSDDVLDFTVYMSPADSWTAVVYAATPTEPARLAVVENDTTCTVPVFPAIGEQFKTFRLHPNLSADVQNSETREGYIEIFNMADVPPTAAPAANATLDSLSLYNAIEHAANGQPRIRNATTGNCEAGAVALTQAAPVTTPYADPGTPAIDSAIELGMEVPTTGLMANWIVANPAAGRSWSGAAVAVEGRVGATEEPGFGNVVFHPQNGNNVALNLARERTADALLRGVAVAAGPDAVLGNADDVVTIGAAAAVQPLNVDLPDMSTPYLNNLLGAGLASGVSTRRQAQNLTEALATRSVTNEVLSIGQGRTDWTFTMPTRRYQVVRAYSTNLPAGCTGEACGSTLFTSYGFDDADAVIGAAATYAAGANYFVPGTDGTSNVVSENVAGKRHQLCVTGITTGGARKGLAGDTNLTNRFTGLITDRDENIATAGGPGSVFSPAPPAAAAAAFCGEVGVFAYNTTASPTPVLSAAVATRVITTAPRNFGWMRFGTPGLANGPAAQPNLGLPVVGFAFMTFENLSIALPHRNAR